MFGREGLLRDKSKAVNSKGFNWGESTDHKEGAAVSRSMTKKDIGNVSFFAFDTNQGLSENTIPFDSEIYILNGEAEITICGQQQHVVAGEMLNIPANITHSLQAKEPFVMMLVMVSEE
jgi:quercetin dioxygenase-like cupin family protein